jgi:hypothetical protein
MSAIKKNRLTTLAALGLPPVMLGVLILVITAWGQASTKQASADIPHPGLDFSIGVDTNGDTTPDCNTTGGPTKCTFASAGGVFTLKVFLNALGGIAGYQGFDIRVNTAGVTVDQDATGAPIADAHSWPQCTFQGLAPYNTAYVVFGCASFNVMSTYTGVIGTVELTCTQTGTLTLVHGRGNTDLIENPTAHAEGQGTTEALDINCGGGGGPTATNTPAAATPTPTPTPTPTATPRPRNGDANKDGTTNAIDAALVLQYGAGLLPSINPSSDVSGDGTTNAIDAAVILQYAAGLLNHLPVG